jgi:hypothetical protein
MDWSPLSQNGLLWKQRWTPVSIKKKGNLHLFRLNFLYCNCVCCSVSWLWTSGMWRRDGWHICFSKSLCHLSNTRSRVAEDPGTEVTRRKHCTLMRCVNLEMLYLLCAMAARSRMWVCDRLLAGIGGFEYRWENGCLSLVSVVYCQVEVFASVWSLVQRSPTECGVSECDRRRGLCPIGLSNRNKKNGMCQSRWPCSIGCRSAAAYCWDRRFESCWRHGCSLMSVMCCVGSGFCNVLITGSEESCRVCMYASNCVWSRNFNHMAV